MSCLAKSGETTAVLRDRVAALEMNPETPFPHI